jgi:hypothetical protein
MRPASVPVLGCSFLSFTRNRYYMRMLAILWKYEVPRSGRALYSRGAIYDSYWWRAGVCRIPFEHEHLGLLGARATATALEFVLQVVQ